MSRCVVCGNTVISGGGACADGKICRRCWNKISENLNGIRSMPSRKLRSHVAWRDENMSLYNVFNPTSVVGKLDKLHVDNTNKLFAVSIETSSLKYKPDIFRFDELAGYCLDVKDENGSISPYGPRLAPEVYKHRATCRFTPPPELPTLRNGESVPPESRYINDGERDTWVSVYLYLNNPWIPFIRMFVTKRPCGSPGTRSYNKAVTVARGIIAILKDILTQNGPVTQRTPTVTRNHPGGAPLGPNPVFSAPPPPSFGPNHPSFRPPFDGGYPAPPAPRGGYNNTQNAQKPVQQPVTRVTQQKASYAPVKCPVCGAVGQTGKSCEYCGTALH